jgi:DNA-binding CsgD family transcriptional regulator
MTTAGSSAHNVLAARKSRSTLTREYRRIFWQKSASARMPAKPLTGSCEGQRRADSFGIITFAELERQSYHCRYFPLHVNGNGQPNCRRLFFCWKGARIKLRSCARFRLTPREQETVKLLFEGLTSEESANRMKISANTSGAFLRLVMVKMDVSTRSGIVGKIAGSTG